MTAFVYQGPLFCFGHLTNAAYMKKVWSVVLPEIYPEFISIHACRINFAKCRVHLANVSWSKSFVNLVYELDVSDNAAKPSELLLYAKVFLNGNSRLHYEKLADQYERAGKSVGFKHIPDLDMIVWRFPDDPGLPQLARLLDAEQLIDYLPYHCLPIARREDVKAIKVKAVRYRPEQRCILRIEVNDDNAIKPFIIYAKIFEDEKGEQVYNVMRHFNDYHKSVEFCVPQTLAYNASLHSIWQCELEGIPLAEQYSTKQRQYIFHIGHILADIHSSRPLTIKTVERAKRLIEMQKKSAKITQAFPALANDIVRLNQRMRHDLLALPPERQMVIHGDVHIGQFMVMPNNEVAILDFDSCCLGEPEQDLADLIVDPHLSQYERSSLQQNRMLSADIVAYLLSSYRHHAAFTVDVAVLKWHARVQFVNKAYRAATAQEPNWQEKIPELISLAVSETIFTC